MKPLLLTALLCATFAPACAVDLSRSGADDRDPGAAESHSLDALPEQCQPSVLEASAAQTLQEAAAASVHELVTCGGMQVSLANAMISAVVLSNEAQFDTDSVARMRQLGFAGNVDFTQSADGSWRTPMGEGSDFVVRFSAPDDREPLTLDPFELDSYLRGVRVSSTMTFDEMLKHPERDNVFTYHWEELGPLGHLLAHGETVENPFEVRLSGLDLALGWLGADSAVDLGPFDALLDVNMTSKVELSEERGAVTVEYAARGRRATVDQVRTGGVGFDVDRISARFDEFELIAEQVDVEYLARGTLAGNITYSLAGTDRPIALLSDFGMGRGYPSEQWSCVE